MKHNVNSAYSWEESQRHIPKIRSRAIQQCLSWYLQVNSRSTFNQLLWGDETEYMLILLNSERREVKLSLTAHTVLERIRNKILTNDEGVSWFSEHTKFMIEGTPSKPYDGTIKGLLKVEPLMKSRKESIQRYLKHNETLVTLSSYPRLGVGKFSVPYYRPKNIEDEGDSISNETIHPTPRYHQFVRNIIDRRGYISRIDLLKYQENNAIESSSPNLRSKCFTNKVNKSIDKYVALDHTVFGSGCTCLQVTFQAGDLNEALYLHDQLATIAPLMLALTAATPIFKGFLCDTDCRFSIISRALDDRTPEERNVDDSSSIPQRPRCGSIPRYISDTFGCNVEYNDVEIRYNEDAFKILSAHGMDEPLARYFAHIFSYDPLYMPKSRIESNIKSDSYEEFETFLVMMYPSIRLKIPPIHTTMGWRVEVRTMENQPNDFENAAFAVVMNLLVRIILKLQLNFLIPISKIDDNMERAQITDAARQQKFWFKKNIFSLKPSSDNNNNSTDIQDEYTLLTLNQIFNGETDVFIGLIPVIHQYLDQQDLNIETRQQLNKYLDLVQNKANGSKLTTAQRIREFVINHPNYLYDSYVDDVINFDLVNTLFL